MSRDEASRAAIGSCATSCTGRSGPLDSASAVFTDAAVQELLRRRFRYAVARWGASPNVMCWELWNEVSGVDGLDREASSAWHG